MLLDCREVNAIKDWKTDKYSNLPFVNVMHAANKAAENLLAEGEVRLVPVPVIYDIATLGFFSGWAAWCLEHKHAVKEEA